MLEELKKIIEKSWSKETCYPDIRDNWNESNPFIGQCAITALIVNDFLVGNKRLKIYGRLDCTSALRHINNGKKIKNKCKII